MCDFLYKNTPINDRIMINEPDDVPKDFDWVAYVSYYDDLRHSGIDTEEKAKKHYVDHGRSECRQFKAKNLEYSSLCENYNKYLNNVSYQNNYANYFDASSSNEVNIIAFYFPQFHEIAENNEFWGNGFTEWTNVTKAVPFFEDHYQPKLPGDFGFYNLEYDTAILYKQSELAKKIGINTFCFYYYDFGDKQLMTKPIKNFLDSNIDMKFCLCWANENWTKRWDGLDNEILIKQNYDEHYENFIYKILDYFNDNRYIKINNSPLLIIYKSDDIPDINNRIHVWNKVLKDNGFNDLYLLYINGEEDAGFDGSISFAPTNVDLLNINKILDNKIIYQRHSMGIFDYQELIDKSLLKLTSDNIYPCICPSWDNSPRRVNNCGIFINDHQNSYCEWILESYKKSKSTKEKLLFINAWNEWGEGTYLEPDRKFGYKNANAHTIANILRDLHIDKSSNELFSLPTKDRNQPKVAYIIHCYYEELLQDILNKISNTSEEYDLFVSIPRNCSEKLYPLIFCNNPYTKILHVDNVGRDILPWLRFNEKVDFSTYDCVCKLHTKKTISDPDLGENNRELSLKRLVGNNQIISHNTSLIRDGYSMLVPIGLKYSLSEYIGSNLNNIQDILCKNIDIQNYTFGAGTMFFYDPKAMNGILKLFKNLSFNNEPIGIDGDICHAIERIFGWYVESNGYDIIEV
jgi:lipopolysaccharide biosynthesis protein